MLQASGPLLRTWIFRLFSRFSLTLGHCRPGTPTFNWYLLLHFCPYNAAWYFSEPILRRSKCYKALFWQNPRFPTFFRDFKDFHSHKSPVGHAQLPNRYLLLCFCPENTYWHFSEPRLKRSQKLQGSVHPDKTPAFRLFSQFQLYIFKFLQTLQARDTFLIDTFQLFLIHIILDREILYRSSIRILSFMPLWVLLDKLINIKIFICFKSFHGTTAGKTNFPLQKNLGYIATILSLMPFA